MAHPIIINKWMNGDLHVYNIILKDIFFSRREIFLQFKKYSNNNGYGFFFKKFKIKKNYLQVNTKYA